jgi:hypothetical protein
MSEGAGSNNLAYVGARAYKRLAARAEEWKVVGESADLKPCCGRSVLREPKPPLMSFTEGAHLFARASAEMLPKFALEGG